MWKESRQQSHFNIAALLFFTLLFFLVYFFYPIQKFPYWSMILMILGLLIPIFFFAAKVFYPLFAVLVVFLLFNHQTCEVISYLNFKSFEFFLQWGLFFWGLEIAASLDFSKKALFSNSLRVLLAVPVFFLVYLVTAQWEMSLLCSFILAGASPFYSRQNKIADFNLLIYLGLWITYLLLIDRNQSFLGITYIIVLLLGSQLFVRYLSSKLKLKVFILLLSILSVIYSYSVVPIPLLLTGMLCGLFFQNQINFKLGFWGDFYKYLIVIIYLSQLEIQFETVWVSFAVVGFLYLTQWLVFRNRFDATFASMPLELPLSFYVIFSQFYYPYVNLLLFIPLLGIVLICAVQYKKVLGSHFASIKLGQ